VLAFYIISSVLIIPPVHMHLQYIPLSIHSSTPAGQVFSVSPAFLLFLADVPGLSSPGPGMMSRQTTSDIRWMGRRVVNP